MEVQKPVCAICGTTEQLLRCAKCKTVYYCSTTHQHIDWPSHKHECRRLARQKDNNKQLQQLQQAVAAATLNNSTSTTITATSATHKQQSCDHPNSLDSNVVVSVGVTEGGGIPVSDRDESDASDVKSNNLNPMSLMLGTNENEILNTQAESVSPSNSNGVDVYLGNIEANSTTIEQMNNCSNGSQQPETSCVQESAHQEPHQQLHVLQAAQKQPQKQLQDNHVTITKKNNNKQSEKSTSYQIKRIDEKVLGNAHERRYEELCRIIINDMNQYGLSVLDDFLGMQKGLDILSEVHRMYATGVFKDGQLVSNSIAEQDLRTIRGDKITWVKGVEAGCSSIGYLINQIDAVICRANTMNDNGKLGSYNIRERTKAMVACYPGSGSHYVMHVDNPNHDGRVITAIYYLNLNWDTNRSGGMLRIFPEHGGSVADIEPKFDRLIFFWSDMRNPHEVQPAHRTRYAITVWYFDANEREDALNRFRHCKSKASSRNATQPAKLTTASDVCT